MVSERPVGHVLVDEDHLRVLVAVAHERDQVAVPELGEHLDFRLKLVHALLRGCASSFDGNLGPVVELAEVDFSEAAHAYDRLVLEVARGVL